MNHLISMFIDDEMTIDEKIQFVNALREDSEFSNQTLSFVRIEKDIQSDVVDHIPEVIIKEPSLWIESARKFFRPMGLAASFFGATAAILLYFLLHSASISGPNRFVIYQPSVDFVEIAGTFTGWKRVAMKRIGNSGYWEISLNLSQGEHRYAYILEGIHSVADPTVLAKETDDFGGQNTIINVEHRT